MATGGLRRVLQWSLPALPALLFAMLVLFAVPQPATVAVQVTVVCAVVTFALLACGLVACAFAALAAEPEVVVPPPPAPIRHPIVLLAQYAAGVRGSRAPPAASV